MAHGWKRQRCMAIMVFMVLMLAMTHCFKISNRLKVETGTNLKTKDHSSSTSKDSTSQDSSSSSTTEQTPPVEVPEGTTFTIKRSSSTNADDESNEIVVGNKDFENLMKDSYKQMRDKFSFSQATVTTQDQYFTITTKSTTANSEDFNSFLSLSSNYNNINSLFSISSSLNVNSLFCYYFVDNKWANKVVDLCFSEASSSTGFYKVEASKLIPNKITVASQKCYSKVSQSLLDLSTNSNKSQYNNILGDSVECKQVSDTGIVTYPDEFQKYKVRYSGNVNYDDGSQITNEDTVGMDNMLVPFTMTTDNIIIQNYNNDNPEFDWVEYPSTNQMTVDLLLRSLDQTLNDESSGIAPPRGLSSINYLGLKTANFHSSSGKFSNIMIMCNMPDFDFLPLDLTSKDNQCLIYYGSHTNVTVNISGSVKFADGEKFSSIFIKANSTNEYTISLIGSKDSTLSFSSIRNIVYPTISTNSGKVLPTDSLSTSKLNLLGITEKDSVINSPVIEIRLSPFLFYKVTGTMTLNIRKDSTKEQQILANFINLDGSVFSYVKLTFDNKTSNDSFKYFYDVTSTDGGLKSLDINGFEVITTNRDFDMKQVNLLSNDFLDIDTQEDIIAKMGVNTKVYAELIADCLDYTFCRVMKSNLVYSQFEFEGPLSKKTVLSTVINNFKMKSGETFSDSTLQIIIDSTSSSNASLNLIGNFIIVTEKDRAISLNANWDFGNKANSVITLHGKMLGIYNDVFKIGLIDLTQVKVNGKINTNGDIYNLNLNGLGIFGKDCYSHQDLINSLQSQDSQKSSTIVDLSGDTKNNDDSISVIKSNCKSAYFKVFINSTDYSQNHVRGILQFDNSEDILRTALNVKSDDHIPQIINNINFPYGLVLDYAYTDSSDDKPMAFKGIMNFMGVNTQGQFNLHSWNNTAKVNIVLPSIKMGGGNFEFITHDDLFYKYGLSNSSDSFDSRNLDIKADFNSLVQNNTLKFKLEKDSLSSSKLLLESDILIFEMVNRTITYLNSDLMSFSIIANPFKGIFNANTTIEIKPEENIEAESNSVVQMNFTQNDEYFNLEQTANDYLQEWVSRVIKVTKQTKFLLAQYNDKLDEVKQSYTKESDCEVYEQCRELPTIVCDEYAQQAVCAKETSICLNMVQVCTKQSKFCTRTNTNGDCQQEITKCDKWETQCQDSSTSNVCSEFESNDIPNNCLKMELVCSTTKQKDQECVSQSKEAEVFIKKTQEDIDDLNALLANIQQLRDSCVCALNNANDKIKTPTCSLKDIKIDSILDNLDLLDLVTLSDVKANMQLDKVIAADEIIFSSKIWLYGDWTNKLLKKRDELVIKNDLHIEEEKTKEGYTNGAKSLITLNHHVNFNSIELTAREMANQIEMIVCKEFNITNDISKKIQNSIVEFNLMDGNSTICPTYSKLDLSATSEGLYSDYIEKESSKDQNKGLGSYKYSFGKGRSKINVTEERIDNMNTLTYQQKINSPKDVSIIEGVTNDLSKTTTQPSIPVTDASVEYQINPDDKDSGSGTKEENSSSTNSAIEQSGAEVEYTQEVKEEQDSIDAQKVAQKS